MPIAQSAQPSDDLQTLKRQLCELDNLKLLNPDDLEILDARRALRRKITEMEMKNEPAPRKAA